MSVPLPPCSSSLLDVFGLISDWRKPRGKVYPLPSLLVLCVVAVLHGCRNPTQIFAFGGARPELLRRLGFHPPKRRRGAVPKPAGTVSCPNEDTIGSALAHVSPQAMNDALSHWIVRLLPAGAHAAIDGKALRGADEHILEVFANDLHLVVWQMPVGEKENELSALEKGMADILAKYPQLKLLTGDAMFCQKSIAKALHEARRHYVLQLKSPHKTDVALAADALRQLSTQPPAAATEEKRGGLMAASSSLTRSGSTRGPTAMDTTPTAAGAAGPDCAGSC